MGTWRAAGLNYVNYSTIAARVLRNSLKSELRDAAVKRDKSAVSVLFWLSGEVLPPGQKPTTDKDKEPT